MAQHLRKRMNKYNCIKINHLFTTKEAVDSRNCPQDGRKFLPALHLVRDKYSESTYSERKRLNPQRINMPMKNWAHELHTEFSRKKYK
jgi:hypothetical protein